MSLTYSLNDLEMVPVAPVIVITLVFAFHIWIWIFSADFQKNTSISNFTKIRSVGAEFHAYGRTDREAGMTRLMVAIRNFSNAPINTHVVSVVILAYSLLFGRLGEVNETAWFVTSYLHFLHCSSYFLLFVRKYPLFKNIYGGNTNHLNTTHTTYKIQLLPHRKHSSFSLQNHIC
jgi:hypothetical protein